MGVTASRGEEEYGHVGRQALEELLEIYPNEMLAQFWANVLEQEGIRSMIKPQRAGYGMWGRDSFIEHGLYVLSENIEQARVIIKEVDGS